MKARGSSAPPYRSARNPLCLLVLLGATTFLSVACGAGGGGASFPGSTIGQSPPPTLIQVPESLVRRCLAVPVVGAICPRRLPAVDGRYDFGSSPGAGRTWVVDFSFGGSYPGFSRRNAPPRFAHLSIKGGRNLDRLFPFSFPLSGRPHRVSAASPLPHRTAVFLGRDAWDGRTGVLVLAPRYPLGGDDGGHLIFRWREHGLSFAVSLHAWIPLPQAEAALEAIVASISRPAASGRSP